MKQFLAALDKLQAEPELWRRNRLHGKIDARVECGALVKSADRLREFVSTISIRRPVVNPAFAWRAFEEGGCRIDVLSPVQIRSLCSTPSYAVHSQFVEALSQNVAVLRRSLYLYGVVGAYFSFWRTMETPARLERVILDALAAHSQFSPFVRVWKAQPDLFSAYAAEYLAELIVKRRARVAEVLESLFVGAGSRLATMTRAHVSVQACALVPENETLNWIFQEALAPPLLDNMHAAAVSSLLMSQAAERAGAVQDRLREYAMKDGRLGDPGLEVNRANWVQMVPEAEKRLVSWMARDSIQFFFSSVVADTSENRQRREFWLGYASVVRDFQIALCEQDWLRFKGLRDVRLRGFARVDHAVTSALLMQFDGDGGQYVVFEFSEIATAAFVYRRKMFEASGLSFRSGSFSLLGDLKHRGYVDLLSHEGDWCGVARKRLGVMGIQRAGLRV